MVTLKETTHTKEELEAKINIKKFKYFDFDKKYHISEENPLHYLNYRRFDIPAKHIYGWFKENGIQSSWGARLYYEHIRVLNNYDEEGDGSGKVGIDSFEKSFESTLVSIKENGFDSNKTLIPIGANNELLDGAHRLTAAILYKHKIKSIKLDEYGAKYDYQFFMNRGLDSLDTKWADAMACEYCRLKSNTQMIILFPSIMKRKKNIRNIVSKYGNIFYEKDILVGNQGTKNLIIQLFSDKKWIGKLENGFSGVNKKLQRLFIKGDASIKLILFETDSIKRIMEVKKEIQALNIENHQIYISISKETELELAQLLLNENSLHFLNNANPYRYLEVHNLIKTFKSELNKLGINTNNFCIVNSAVLGAYGIFEIEDLNFIYSGKEELIINNKRITQVNSESILKYHNKSVDDIIFNPENHFYYNGIKFSSLTLENNIKLKNISEIYELMLTYLHLLKGSPKFKIKTFSKKFNKRFNIILRKVRKAF
ncbi:hypothetical protein ACM26V_05790 [Salipaludibacillus sp. HK11]|uniref:hypothetical protein n=1 Tax=Salipaludibacillus sp. HK11 TaxID=3394320 RepID=UPI0039FC638B